MVLIALTPIVAATVAAGTISSPSDEPCVTGFSDGFTGAPNHVELGPDRNLWALEGQNDKIARFDLETKTATEYDLPEGTEPHELETGPDGKLWFTGLGGAFGIFDPQTDDVTLFEGISAGSAPHHIFFSPDGDVYVSEREPGLLARFDPKTERLTENTYNLPPDNGIHGFAEHPEGTSWWVLQYADQLARFSVEKQRFDKFVDLPHGSGPHWIVYVPSDKAFWIATSYSNELFRYDPETEEISRFPSGLERTTRSELNTPGLPIASLTQVYAESDGESLWLATLGGGGILRFDLDTLEYEELGCGMLFPGLTITFEEDPSGDLWVTEAAAGPPGTLISGVPGQLSRIDP